MAMALFLFEFWDSETEETFFYLIKSKELESKNGFELERIKGKIQEEYNKANAEFKFEDFEEVYKWLDENIRKFVPDAKPIDFVKV